MCLIKKICPLPNPWQGASTVNAWGEEVMDATLTQITLRNLKNFFGLSDLCRLWRCTLPFCKGQTEAKLCTALRPVGSH